MHRAPSHQLNANPFHTIIAYQHSSARSHLIDDPILWLEDKAKVDRVADGLWRIHGKAYDFDAFAARHPGDIIS